MVFGAFNARVRKKTPHIKQKKISFDIFLFYKYLYSSPVVAIFKQVFESWALEPEAKGLTDFGILIRKLSLSSLCITKTKYRSTLQRLTAILCKNCQLQMLFIESNFFVTTWQSKAKLDNVRYSLHNEIDKKREISRAIESPLNFSSKAPKHLCMLGQTCDKTYIQIFRVINWFLVLRIYWVFYNRKLVTRLLGLLIKYTLLQVRHTEHQSCLFRVSQSPQLQ